MQSVSQHNFARIPAPKIQRSRFDRSSPYKTTFNAGDLIPIFYDEALPGDSFKLNASFFCRLNTPIVPIMDNSYLETFFFEVPMRQVWDNWAKFNGEQDNPGDSTDFLIPQMVSPATTGYKVGEPQDFFGIPTDVADLTHSALPFRAMNHIFNTWFRDQNLQNSVHRQTDDGPDLPSNYPLLKRGKRHDYFTSALPWPQKSDSGSVQIPLGDRAAVKTDLTDTTTPLSILDGTNAGFQLDSAGSRLLKSGTTDSNEPSRLYADLSSATSATINALRQSIAVQRIFEKDARGGTRLIEITENHFGVRSPDLRLQRPGYLGGGKSQINITPVPQQSPSGITPELTPQGNLAAIGTVTGSGHGFTKSFTEHTIILGFACVRADLTYSRGLERSWSRLTRFDFYWPELSTIGEQSILQKEIWATSLAADNDKVWGYQERNAEYRYKPGLITGKFRSSETDSLDYWHLSQDFSTVPVLSEAFIQENPPFQRVVATPAEPQFKMDAYFNLNCARPMPMYGIPGLHRL
nr:MAG: major capsid protein [Microvirus sp.]